MGFDLGSIFGFGGGGGGGEGDSQDVVDTQRRIEQMPDYPEATGAREEMYARLQGWGGQEGYGAIAPDWDAIWGDAEKKLQQYYWGSPTDPGIVGKMKAESARKGQTDQPEYMRSLANLGKTQSDQLGSMAVKQAMERAGFAEKGRLTWMDEMNQLMNLKPQFMETGRTTTKYRDYPEGGGGGVIGGGGGGGGMDWNVFGDVLSQTGTGQAGGGNWWQDIFGGDTTPGQATLKTDPAGNQINPAEGQNAWKFGF